MHTMYLASCYWLLGSSTRLYDTGNDRILTPSQYLKIRHSIANVSCAILELPIIVTSTAKPCVRGLRRSVDLWSVGSCT
jgi:hypothetical protein